MPEMPPGLAGAIAERIQEAATTLGAQRAPLAESTSELRRRAALTELTG